MKREIKLLAASALLLGSSIANAGTVDLFSTDQAFLTDATLADGGLSSSVSTLGTDILGGSRDLYVELLSSSDPANLNASIGVSAGFFSFSTDSVATGTGWVQWDGADNSIALDMTGLGGVDITDGNTLNAFAVDIINADLGFDFEINAYTDAGNWTSAHLVSNATSGTATINFADFTNCGLSNPGGGILNIGCAGGTNPVDFTNLGALELKITPTGGTVSLDLSLDQITTVPEPSVLGLMGIGLFAAGFVGRRRKDRGIVA